MFPQAFRRCWPRSTLVLRQGATMGLKPGRSSTTQAQLDALRAPEPVTWYEKLMPREVRQALFAGTAFLRLAADPNDTSQVFKICDAMQDNASPAFRKFAWNHLMTDPALKQMYEERYDPPLPDLQKLKALPERTLGRVYAEHMLHYGLTVDFFQVKPDADFLSFVGNRARITHDIYHVFADYGVSPEEELLLQRFTFCQNLTLGPFLISTLGTIVILKKDPKEIIVFMKCMNEAEDRAFAAKPLTGFKWENHFETDLEELREMLALPPRKSPRLGEVVVNQDARGYATGNLSG